MNTAVLLSSLLLVIHSSVVRSFFLYSEISPRCRRGTTQRSEAGVHTSASAPSLCLRRSAWRERLCRPLPLRSLGVRKRQNAARRPSAKGTISSTGRYKRCRLPRLFLTSRSGAGRGPPPRGQDALMISDCSIGCPANIRFAVRLRLRRGVAGRGAVPPPCY